MRVSHCPCLFCPSFVVLGIRKSLFLWCRRNWRDAEVDCAGVCKYEGRGGMCSIRLSEPLLKLRPRKDLVETLLHEMIHALLFVTNNDKDRESHGPEFCKHMHRINRLTGANVTIYHSFHDEVDLYRQHWWRCNGPCRNRRPYFGYVKRAMNRAPSARDFWWAEHQERCGGTFTKVKEPENFSKKSKEKTQPAELPSSESTNKGKTQTRDTQCQMPFSGKGYRLGGDSGLSEKNRDSSSSVRKSETPGSQHRSAVKTIPIPKNEIKFEKSPRSGILFPLYTGDGSEKINLGSKREFPKLSVANTKAYKNVGGSPVKIPHVTKEKSSQGSASGKRVMPLFYTRAPKQICFEETSASQVASEKKSSEGTNVLQQWPKSEDRTAFENYFIRKDSSDVPLSMNTAMKTKADSSVSSASSSTAVRQDKKVSCPVCQTEVLESKINEHLDSCLA
ncbi:PREDICTED: sprT-like domain-containing protein Spartan [Chaetura pelagica]|uniref:sprT-like domain-containing protein Spartan n=1 Tax=Chaetura pelagica TaxID=8897 RepID=UPI0005238D0C|nr:PREDICTED: sprT-like domain-containing protein Spartan [Chaetura pelagica]